METSKRLRADIRYPGNVKGDGGAFIANNVNVNVCAIVLRIVSTLSVSFIIRVLRVGDMLRSRIVYAFARSVQSVGVGVLPKFKPHVCTARVMSTTL